MHTFSNPHIAIANTNDIPQIKHLLNISYRGETSKQGWTTEAYLIAGDQRTNEESLQQVMQQSGSVMLTYTNDEAQIIGCVNLQQHGQKLYFGMFSVSPVWQGKGIGKQLLQAAEEFARHLPCISIYMSVISVRTELIAWYERHGYKQTGERKFFTEDAVTGKHLQPLQFMILEKKINV